MTIEEKKHDYICGGFEFEKEERNEEQIKNH